MSVWIRRALNVSTPPPLPWHSTAAGPSCVTEKNLRWTKTRDETDLKACRRDTARRARRGDLIACIETTDNILDFSTLSSRYYRAHCFNCSNTPVTPTTCGACHAPPGPRREGPMDTPVCLALWGMPSEAPIGPMNTIRICTRLNNLEHKRQAQQTGFVRPLAPRKEAAARFAGGGGLNPQASVSEHHVRQGYPER